MECEAITCIGKREKNEDSYFIGNYDNFTVLAVADGIGGLPNGEIASTTAVNVLRKECEKLSREQSFFEIITDEFINNLFNMINKEIVKVNLDKELGTTLTVVFVSEKSLVIGHIGDSRGYLIHGSSIIKLTSDHVSECNKNFLLKALGENSYINPDIYRYNIMYGDMILLLTDGIHSFVNDSDILGCLKYRNDIKSGLNKLVELARKSGTNDNMTAVLMYNKLI